MPWRSKQACTGDSLEAKCYRAVRQVAAACRDEIDRRFPKVLRRVGGYNLDEFVDPARPFNLAKLIVGSEGTLGLVVAAKIGLVALPAAKAVLTIEFDDLLDALAATPLILRHRPSAVEVMDRFILDHAKESAALDALRRSVLQTEPGALLCVEMYGDRADDLPPRLEALERDLAGSGFRCQWRRAITAAEQARIWSLREAALGLSMAMKGDDKSLSFVEDTAVAPEKLRDYIDRFLKVIRGHGTVAGVYAHASVGCLHVRPVVNLKTAAGVRRFEAIANDIADLVLEFGGALSGEHGDGLVRGPFTEKMFGPALYGAFRTVKKAFDAAGVFNPGKIVDTPPLTANLRYGAGYQTPDPPTFFDYAEHGGMGRAVEMCSGLGVCRKTLDGTMCPSYMATREEKHSTRGRANALRLAMAGSLGGSGLGDHDVHDVLDLCLECRACKAECPVGVDVARFKSEFLAGYWRRHGMPWRTRAIGHVHALSKLGSRFAPLSNTAAQSGVGRWLNEKLLQIDRRRTPPSFARETFARRFARQIHNPHQSAVRNPQSAIGGPVQRHVHELQPSGSRRGRGRVPRGGGTRRPPRLPRLLRAAVDLAGAAGGSARSGADQRGRARRRGDARGAHRVPRAELPLGGPRRRAGAAARRRAAPGADRRRCLRAVRGLRRAGVAGGTDSRQSAAGTANRAAARALPSESDGAACHRPVRCSAASHRRPWSISTRDAAAWPARSGTRASTTRSRGRSASGSCCPRRGRWRPAKFSSPRACRAGSRWSISLACALSTRLSCWRHCSTYGNAELAETAATSEAFAALFVREDRHLAALRKTFVGRHQRQLVHKRCGHDETVGGIAMAETETLASDRHLVVDRSFVDRKLAQRSPHPLLRRRFENQPLLACKHEGLPHADRRQPELVLASSSAAFTRFERRVGSSALQSQMCVSRRSCIN